MLYIHYMDSIFFGRALIYIFGKFDFDFRFFRWRVNINLHLCGFIAFINSVYMTPKENMSIKKNTYIFII